MNRLERLFLRALLEYIETHGTTEKAEEALRCLGERELAKHEMRLEGILRDVTEHQLSPICPPEHRPIGPRGTKSP